ncbi:MAG: hypothetical protein Q8P18_30710 [Pseudomonadota bacterium]|nr:hypothetical protein [Pseudomonadota bacterium]
MLLFLAGLAAAATPAAATWPAAPTPAARITGALSAVSPGTDTPWRATVASIGPFEVNPGKRVFSPGDTQPFDTIVVSDEGAVVRVAHDSRGVRVVVGVRREDLAPRPDDRAAIRAEPGKVPATGGVALAGGTAITLGAKAHGDVRIAWSEDGLTLDGWVPAAAVGPLWRVTRWQMDGRFADLALVDPTHGDGGVSVPLRDGPGGDVLATLRADTTLLLFAAGAASEGWRPIEVRTPAAQAHGWVPADAVADVPGYAVGAAGGSGGPPLTGSLVELARGAFIHAIDATIPFGRALRDVQVSRLSGDGRRVRVSLPTAWGNLIGEVECRRLTEREGEVPRCEVE